MRRALEAERRGLELEEELTVAGYLLQWLASRREELRPTTFARYRDHVHRDLVPAFGDLRLLDLRARHITAWNRSQLASGRGRTAVHRAGATLSSALSAAARQRLIPDNPARHAVLGRPTAPERLCWSPAQAAAFLRHNRTAYADVWADAFEVLLGTGMRRGEVLGLHWPEVHLQEKVLLVRWNLTAVDNNRLFLGHPKTRASRNWVSLSPRVAQALGRRVEAARAALGPQAPLEGLVFCRLDGSPLRPQQVLVTLRRRAAEIGLPRIGVHDLRHTAATIMISSGVPPAVVSKTLRHSTLSTTVNLYGHLLPHAARDAVRALGRALERADRDHGPTGTAQAA
ncbi:tyrosine-type recombinase/integrase [Streptomyces sp. URMC 125]|uniref:tyrosine-type recombinase/integrase n=1 Tax=Streptomyces sp. URMC 125 TaxID=3423419 RepID=UPI003F1D36E7